MPTHPTRYYGGGDLHFITAGCYHRQPFLGTAQSRDLFLCVLEQMRRRYRVSQEAQLKPGVADNPLINKIVNDFGPDELDDIRDQYLENSRFRHAFGNIGPEAWKTMSLQTYFPDLKIPATTLARTQKAISAAPSNADDLTGILQQSLAQAKARQ